MRGAVYSLLVLLFPLSVYAQCAMPGAFGRTALQEAECWNTRMAEVARQNQAAMEKFEKLKATNIKNAEAVSQCYAKLTLDSSTEEMLKAVSCLEKSPFAGEAVIKHFTSANSTLLKRLIATDRGRELATAVDNLIKRKQTKVYWVVSGGNSRVLFVPDTYEFPEDVGTVYDLEALGASLVTKSRILTSDERIPLTEVVSFLFRPGYSTTGAFTVEAKGGQVYSDDSYQAYYPIRYYYGENDKSWSALMRVRGAMYREGTYASVVEDQVLSLSQDGISNITVKLVDEALASKWINEVSKIVNTRKQEANASAAAAKRLQEEGLNRVRNAAKGDEDSCEGRINNAYPLTDKTLVKCQLLNTEVPISSLKQYGWLITNVSNLPQNNDGFSTVIIAVKKAM